MLLKKQASLLLVVLSVLSFFLPASQTQVPRSIISVPISAERLAYDNNTQSVIHYKSTMLPAEINSKPDIAAYASELISTTHRSLLIMSASLDREYQAVLPCQSWAEYFGTVPKGWPLIKHGDWLVAFLDNDVDLGCTRLREGEQVINVTEHVSGHESFVTLYLKPDNHSGSNNNAGLMPSGPDQGKGSELISSGGSGFFYSDDRKDDKKRPGGGFPIISKSFDMLVRFEAGYQLVPNLKLQEATIPRLVVRVFNNSIWGAPEQEHVVDLEQFQYWYSGWLDDEQALELYEFLQGVSLTLIVEDLSLAFDELISAVIKHRLGLDCDSVYSDEIPGIYDCSKRKRKGSARGEGGASSKKKKETAESGDESSGDESGSDESSSDESDDNGDEDENKPRFLCEYCSHRSANLPEYLRHEKTHKKDIASAATIKPSRKSLELPMGQVDASRVLNEREHLLRALEHIFKNTNITWALFYPLFRGSYDIPERKFTEIVNKYDIPQALEELAYYVAAATEEEIEGDITNETLKEFISLLTDVKQKTRDLKKIARQLKLRRDGYIQSNPTLDLTSNKEFTTAELDDVSLNKLVAGFAEKFFFSTYVMALSSDDMEILLHCLHIELFQKQYITTSYESFIDSWFNKQVFSEQLPILAIGSVLLDKGIDLGAAFRAIYTTVVDDESYRKIRNDIERELEEHFLSLKQLPDQSGLVDQQEAQVLLWIIKKTKWQPQPVSIEPPPKPAKQQPRRTPNRLDIVLEPEDADTIISVMKDSLFGPTNWRDLGLALGIYTTTLEVIDHSHKDAFGRLPDTIKRWLQKIDKVDDTRWERLIKAVRSTGDNAAADRITRLVKALE